MASVVTQPCLLVAIALVMAPSTLSAATARPALPLMCGAPARTAQPAPPASVASRRIAQLHHVPEADLTFEGRLAEDGSFTTEVRGGELVFQKKSLPGGGVVLHLSAPGDVVRIEVTGAGIAVQREGRDVRLNMSSISEDELEGVRQLLAGSRAVRLTRRAAEALYLSNDDSLAGTSLFVADAIVGLLTGDEGAPGRVARHLSQRGRAMARRIAIDCYAVWETQVVQAYSEYESCYYGFPVWNTMRNLCAYRWVLQVETYWFSMISCIGFNQF
jgi:hypothetical protein